MTFHEKWIEPTVLVVILIPANYMSVLGAPEIHKVKESCQVSHTYVARVPCSVTGALLLSSSTAKARGASQSMNDSIADYSSGLLYDIRNSLRIKPVMYVYMPGNEG